MIVYWSQAGLYSKLYWACHTMHIGLWVGIYAVYSLFFGGYVIRLWWICMINLSMFLGLLHWQWGDHMVTLVSVKYSISQEICTRFVVLCFVVVMQSFIMNSHEVFIHIHQGCFAGPGAIVRLPQCQWSKPDGYGKISQCITTTKHSKAKTVCIFLGIYCNPEWNG